MIDHGRAFGATLALKHILGLLEQKGVVSQDEITTVLDNALDELRAVSKRTGIIAPEAIAEASRAIGYIYVRKP